MVLTWKWSSIVLPQFLGCLGSCSWCVCSLLSVVLCTQVGVILLSPCAWVHCISCGYSLEYVLYAVHYPLEFCTM